MQPDSLITFANELNRDGDGWALLAPFGDFRSVALVVDPSGQVKRADSIQRLDRASAETMVENFNGVVGRVKRFFSGVPIFLGHPDVPGIGASYKDAREKGVIAGLEVREDGLYAKPVFNQAGVELINGDAKLYFSGRWDSEFLGTEKGLPVLRPRLVKSVGLTGIPHLPTELLNDSQSQTPPPEMKLSVLIALLQKAGIELANDATEAAAETALGQLIEKAGAGAELANAAETTRTTIAQREADLAAARTELANERAARVDEVLDLATETGRITVAERETWKPRLVASFANERTALLALKPKVPTGVQAGERKAGSAEFGNAADRRKAFLEAVSQKMNAGQTYDQAFAAVQKEKPELLGA